jgi:hypothetical protein
VTISRTWRAGDTIEVDLPFTLRTERALDDPSVQSLMYGPVHLVARDSRTEWLPISLYASTDLTGDLSGALEPVPGKPLHFRVGGIELAPFFEGTTDPFHSYVRRTEPRIVFASLDSGVANPARADGTTVMDAIWAGAPFRNGAEFVGHVRTVTNGWVTDGLLTTTERTRVVETAKGAKFRIR